MLMNGSSSSCYVWRLFPRQAPVLCFTSDRKSEEIPSLESLQTIFLIWVVWCSEYYRHHFIILVSRVRWYELCHVSNTHPQPVTAVDQYNHQPIHHPQQSPRQDWENVGKQTHIPRFVSFTKNSLSCLTLNRCQHPSLTCLCNFKIFFSISTLLSVILVRHSYVRYSKVQ